MGSLYKNGKSFSDIINEYDLTNSTFHKWVKLFTQSGSYKGKEFSPRSKLNLRSFKKNLQPGIENNN